MADSEMIEDDSNVDSTEVDNDTEDRQETVGEEKKDSSKLYQLPHTRVRNMMKLDTDLHIASQDSVFLVTKAAELFVQFFAQEAYKKSLQSKRKTIQKRDLDSVITEIDSMMFLEGALE